MGDRTDAEKLGFRDPPDVVSMSCLTYMARVMELRNFISLFFGMVKSSHEMATMIGPEKLEALTSVEGGEFRSLIYNFSSHRQIVNELMLSRAVESFDLYLISIMREIFLDRPEMLKAEGKIDIAEIIGLENTSDIVSKIVEKKLHELSYKSLSDLGDYIESRTGIKPFMNKDVYRNILSSSEVRNLIAHNDCCVNEIFWQRTKSSSEEYDISERGKLRLSDEWVRLVSYTMDSVVFHFDEAVCSKFGIPKHNRMTTFFLRP